MAIEVIHVGAGDSEQGHYSITPGGHLASGGLYLIPVNGENEITFDIVPDDGWLIGMVYIYNDGRNPDGVIQAGSISSYTFTNLQSNPSIHPDATIWAYAFPYETPVIPPAPKCSFPWGWVIAAGVAGLAIGRLSRSKK
jgi:hypothetical protein